MYSPRPRVSDMFKNDITEHLRKFKSTDHVIIKFEGFLAGFCKFVALNKQFYALPVAFNEFSKHSCQAVFDIVGCQIQDLQTGVFDIESTSCSLLDFKNKGNWLLGSSFLSFLVSLQHLIPGFLLQLVLFVLLLC